MKRMTATLIVNVLILFGVFSLVGIVFWVTKSPLALLGLLFLATLKQHYIPPKNCPKCMHKIPVKDDED